jgi:hypothetical protein
MIYLDVFGPYEEGMRELSTSNFGRLKACDRRLVRQAMLGERLACLEGMAPMWPRAMVLSRGDAS